MKNVIILCINISCLLEIIFLQYRYPTFSYSMEGGTLGFSKMLEWKFFLQILDHELDISNTILIDFKHEVMIAASHE